LKTPYIQGHLDGLCGVYAIVNSLCSLYNLNRKQAEEIFKLCVKTIDHKVSHAICNGMGNHDIRLCLKQVSFWLEKNNYGCLGWEQVFKNEEIKSIRTWLRALHNAIDNFEAIAIVGFDYPHAHWTVVSLTTKKTLKFIDSEKMKKVNKSKLTIRQSQNKKKWIVDTEATFILYKLEKGKK